MRWNLYRRAASCGPWTCTPVGDAQERDPGQPPDSGGYGCRRSRFGQRGRCPKSGKLGMEFSLECGKTLRTSVKTTIHAAVKAAL